MERYDLVILGGGAAAFAAATEADRLGLKTVIVNDGLPMGGTCVNVGCMPTKHLLAVAGELHGIRHPRFASISSTPPAFDFARAMAEKDHLITEARRKNYQEVLAGFKHVTWIDGRGVFASERAVRVGEKEIEGEHILIATGCRTKVYPIEGLEATGYITNPEALALQRLPSSLVVLGGGPLGLEFAQIFARFGAKVTIVEAAKRIASVSEPEISEALRGYLQDEGIGIRTGVKIRRVRRNGSIKEVIVEADGREEVLRGEEILVATGVVGNIEGLGLEEIGVETERGCNVRVNEFLQTSLPHIWAAGDVVCHICLETVAAKEGKMAVENAFRGAKKTLDSDSIPFAVFTDPEVAGVGLTEAQYMARYGTCTCRTVQLSQVPKALAVNDTRGLVKMVVHHETGRVMGVHILAPHAAEMTHEAALAVRLGLTVDDLIETTHVFPTYCEGIKMAAQAFRRDIGRMSCCVE
ncbi:dihydrolipoamide dehydrogenase [Desulfuromonas sp. DDH964]|uniref:mercury(II) reductase n=1 Tax=Desulfuromonas sp. DDH964 TaxID=1823759 RepID=UPI00078E9463|nr:mercury(II) reductase [Desulfuromonas sp. DDH964]AMV70685.1 dihydrolipoamide dehydrogenase [Desulfuromonas sp. DDH964]